MAEYKLSYTASEINNRLGKIDEIESEIADLDIPTITQEAGESESLVMSQKAVTDLVSEAIGTNGATEYETVDSIEEMTDISKQYVLSTDGYIYAYTETTQIVEHEAENKFVASEAQINKRMGSSSISNQNGYVWSGAIPVDLTKESPFRVKVEGTKILEPTSSEVYQKLWLCADNTGTSKLNASILFNASVAYTKVTTVSDDGVFHADYVDGAKLSNDIITQTKYLRIGFKFSDSAINSNSELSGVKITFPYEAYTEEVITTSWVNTGMKPSQNDGGNYITLLTKINKNTSNIDEMNSRVTTLESGSSSVTIPSYWEGAVKACISKIKNLQVGRNCVTFPFFSDNHKNNRCAGALIAYIMKECNMPYCFFGGDAISNGADVVSESVMIEQDNLFDEMMSVIPVERMCRTLGNHDAYWNPTPDDSSQRVYYSRAQIYDLFLRQESISQNKHYGGDGTYYYVDDLASKTRFIVCNMNFNVNTSTETLDSEQIGWLENEAMMFDKGGWSIVFISHQPITNHYHSNIYAETANAIQALLANYVNGNNANKADIVGWFSGHIHADRIYTGAAANTTDDSVKNTLPWKTITIRADATNLCRDASLAITPANDNKSHAIDFITINKTTKTVSITRLGAGEDRSYTY